MLSRAIGLLQQEVLGHCKPSDSSCYTLHTSTMSVGHSHNSTTVTYTAGCLHILLCRTTPTDSFAGQKSGDEANRRSAQQPKPHPQPCSAEPVHHPMQQGALTSAMLGSLSCRKFYDLHRAAVQQLGVQPMRRSSAAASSLIAHSTMQTTEHHHNAAQCSNSQLQHGCIHRCLPAQLAVHAFGLALVLGVARLAAALHRL